MLYDDINFNRQSQLFSKYTTESWDHYVGLCESNPNTLVTGEVLRLMMTSIAQTSGITLSHAVTVSPLTRSIPLAWIATADQYRFSIRTHQGEAQLTTHSIDYRVGELSKLSNFSCISEASKPSKLSKPCLTTNG